MKPNPFWALNHFTVPTAIGRSPSQAAILAGPTGRHKPLSPARPSARKDAVELAGKGGSAQVDASARGRPLGHHRGSAAPELRTASARAAAPGLPPIAPGPSYT